MSLGGHLAAGLGGVLQLHLGEGLVELVLQGSHLVLHILLVRSGNGGAGDGLSVGNVAAQALKAEVVGVAPALGVHGEAALLVVDKEGAGISGTLGDLLHGGQSCLITLVHILAVSQQHGVVGDEDVVGHVANAHPAHGAGGDVLVLEQLEDLDVLVAGLADGAELVVTEHVVLVQGAVGLDVGVQAHLLVLVVHVGDGEAGVVGQQLLGGIVIVLVQVVQTVHHALIHPVQAAGVGGAEVNDVLVGIAHKGSALLGHLDQLVGGDDVLVVQVHTADDRHVGLQEDHVVGHLDGHILGAGAVLNVPGLILVADEHAGGEISAVVLIDVQQQVHAGLGGVGLGQDDGGDVGLLNAHLAVHLHFHEGVHAGDVLLGVAANGIVAVNGLSGGDGHALLVGAELGVRGVGGVLLAALRAGALILVVGEIGEAVAVVGELPLKLAVAGAAQEGVTLGPLALGHHEPLLVIVPAIVLGTGHKGGLFHGLFRTHIDSGAGRGADGRCCHQRGSDCHSSH